MKIGANDYVAKPVVNEELVARLTNLITQKKLFDQVEMQREKLHMLAMTDQLTTLYNRHFLSDMAPRRLKEVERHGFGLSLIVVDIDHFKQINDVYGHEAGDTVLKEVALVLKNNCREEDMAVRLGGEEFVVLLPHCFREGAINKAEFFRKEIESLSPLNINVTASFGVTSIEGKSKIEFSEMFHSADKALYSAKENGRNQVVYCCSDRPLANK